MIELQRKGSLYFLGRAESEKLAWGAMEGTYRKKRRKVEKDFRKEDRAEVCLDL
jgi:hypothetical protein